jgi:two-component system, OmpR family, response regulator RegX3
MRRRILVVEDDRTLRQALAFNLTREGYDVTTASDGEAALEAARNQRPDLLLLDVMLPGMSGVEVLRVLRRDGIATPVIIVSAKGDEIDRVVGLKVGADDYVTKPYRLRELVARMRAVLRRAPRESVDGSPDEVVEVDDVRVDLARHEVFIRGEQMSLPLKEFELLALLLAHAGRVLTREILIDRVWGADYVGDTKTLDVHIKRLRTKVEDDSGSPSRIVTVRGVGYKYERNRR